MAIHPTSVRLQPDLKEALKKHAQAQNRSLTNLIVIILLDYIKNPPPWSQGKQVKITKIGNGEYRGEFK